MANNVYILIGLQALIDILFQRGRQFGRADIPCTDCATYISRGMDYRIAKSRNFIRQAKRIEAKARQISERELLSELNDFTTSIFSEQSRQGLKYHSFKLSSQVYNIWVQDE